MSRKHKPSKLHVWTTEFWSLDAIKRKPSLELKCFYTPVHVRGMLLNAPVESPRKIPGIQISRVRTRCHTARQNMSRPISHH